MDAQPALQQPDDVVFSLFIPGHFRALGSYCRAFGQVRDDVRLPGSR